MEPKFYVYTLTNSLTGQIFYVGKGTGNRWSVHEREARSGITANPYKVNSIRKIWSNGGTVLRDKIFLSNSEELAYQVERIVIRSIGLENLTNLTEGGDGIRGTTVRLRQRQAVSRARSKVWNGFIDPNGREFHQVRNLWQFCKKYHLHYRMMLMLDSGAKDSYKGWRKLPLQVA